MMILQSYALFLGRLECAKIPAGSLPLGAYPVPSTGVRKTHHAQNHQATVGALGPPERERIVWDDDITGFGVRVHPTGRKVYIVKYRHEGRSVKVTIGPHGPITPAAARAKAAEIVTLAKTGRDVAGQMPRSKGSAWSCPGFVDGYGFGRAGGSWFRS